MHVHPASPPRLEGFAIQGQEQDSTRKHGKAVALIAWSIEGQSAEPALQDVLAEERLAKQGGQRPSDAVVEACSQSLRYKGFSAPFGLSAV